MATAGIVVCSSYGMSCIECNELQIAPKSSAHVSNYEVRNLWSCDNCGLVTELAVNPRINAAPEPSKSGESLVGAMNQNISHLRKTLAGVSSRSGVSTQQHANLLLGPAQLYEALRDKAGEHNAPP